MMKNRSIIQIIYCCLLFFLSTGVFANDRLKLVRVAILDNFTIEKSSQKYKNAYFEGITSGVQAAKEKGFKIEYKIFTYGSAPLDILNSITDVKNWDPDFIIGPHSSNHFLLLKKYFQNILVISPYATDKSVSKMPNNFYSLSLPDSYMAKATVAFMEKFYPGKNVFNISEGDCKDCVDMTSIFNEMYKNKYPNAKINNSFYSGNKINEINIEKLMRGYLPESIIILQPWTYTDANTLMPLISNYLKQKNTIFIYNLDNWGNSKEAKKLPSNNGIDFSSFRICPLMQNVNSNVYQQFLKNYQKIYSRYPLNAVSYMSYISIASVIDALSNYKTNSKKDSDRKKSILMSFNKMLLKDKNYYRAKSFVAYRLDSKGETKQEIVTTFN